jgi:polar amino acid transport system substrate-binding protein
MLRTFVTVWLLLFALDAQAQERLKVYIKPVEPFVFERNGQPVGYSIDLWERIARDANLPFDLVRVKTVAEMLDALKSGKADVAVGALSITAERERRIDFSHPFYESGLQILVGSQGGAASQSTWAMVKGFFKPQLLKMAGIVVLALLGISHLLWSLERRRNPESFPPRYSRGISESLWWSLSILISGGCENKAPVGGAGRMVAIVWMLAGILLVSYITASVTTAMTINSLTSDINGPGDLPGHVVATVKGSTAAAFLATRRVDVRELSTVDEAYTALAKRQVNAVVYDAPVLQYHTTQDRGSRERLVGRLFQRQNYGFGLQQGSKYRKQINETMLALKENGFFDELQQKWFGERD